MRSASSSTCSRRTTCSPNGSPGSCTTSPSMPSPGKSGVSEPRQAADFLHEAQERERAACLPDAIACYEAAVAAAERGGEQTVLAEALRRLAVVRRHRSEVAAATALCQRSYEVARQAGDDLLAAEALNTLGGLHLSTGAPDEARRVFLEALELGGSNREVRARVEQNLGILANIRGELHEAIARYERSLDAYRDCGDDHGCALAYHNLGMVSADRGWLNAADCYFRESRALAERVGDAYLRGLCLVNHAEVDVTRQRFEDARQKAEEALAVFDQLGAQSAKAEAYRVIGMVYRETGRIVLAESRLGEHDAARLTVHHADYPIGLGFGALRTQLVEHRQSFLRLLASVLEALPCHVHLGVIDEAESPQIRVADPLGEGAALPEVAVDRKSTRL